MDDQHDPRVFLASERTLLAWVRTGIALMGLGFVVAKFGLFLAAAGVPGAAGHIRSTTIGIALVVIGGASVAHAARQHQRLSRELRPVDLPRNYAISFAPLFAFLLAAIAALLAIHMLLRAAEQAEATGHPGDLSDLRSSPTRQRESQWQQFPRDVVLNSANEAYVLRRQPLRFEPLGLLHMPTNDLP